MNLMSQDDEAVPRRSGAVDEIIEGILSIVNCCECGVFPVICIEIGSNNVEAKIP